MPLYGRTGFSNLSRTTWTALMFTKHCIMLHFKGKRSNSFFLAARKEIPGQFLGHPQQPIAVLRLHSSLTFERLHLDSATLQRLHEQHQYSQKCLHITKAAEEKISASIK